MLQLKPLVCLKDNDEKDICFLYDIFGKVYVMNFTFPC